MENKYRSIRHYSIWSSLPVIANLPPLKPGLMTPPNEVNADNYTEAQLRAMVLENRVGGLTGLSVSASLLETLPENFVLEHYLHVRYRSPLSESYYPLRSDAGNMMRLSTSPHCLAGMICTYLVLRSIMEKMAVTIDPTEIYVSRNIYMLTLQLESAIRTTLTAYPNGDAIDRLIIGSFTEIQRFGNNVEETYWVLFDSQQLESYEAADHTPEEAIDHWIANRTQPEW